MTADVPRVVVLAAERADRDHQGIVGYRLRRTTELHAARFYNRSDTFEMAVVFDGETLVGLRILRYSENGREATPDQKAGIERSLNRSAPGAGFAVPFDARHFSEYRYTIEGKQGARFTSLVRDANHGDGNFTENAAGDVIRLVYTPDALPPHASAAMITDDRMEVLPGFWATVREVQHYEGRYGPFYGHGEIVTQEKNFRRFQNRVAALNALNHGDI